YTTLFRSGPRIHFHITNIVSQDDWPATPHWRTTMSTFVEITHAVTNQPTPRVDVNEYTANQALVEAVAAFAPQADTNVLSEIGAHVGAEAVHRHAEIVNTQTQQLHTHDRWGSRIDHVEFHPAYHEIMRASLSYGNHGYAWTNDEEGANADRAARFSLFAQIEPGQSCPISMTHAVVP